MQAPDSCGEWELMYMHDESKKRENQYSHIEEIFFLPILFLHMSHIWIVISVYSASFLHFRNLLSIMCLLAFESSWLFHLPECYTTSIQVLGRSAHFHLLVRHVPIFAIIRYWSIFGLIFVNRFLIFQQNFNSYFVYIFRIALLGRRVAIVNMLFILFPVY